MISVLYLVCTLILASPFCRFSYPFHLSFIRRFVLVPLVLSTVYSEVSQEHCFILSRRNSTHRKR
ncbi:hypothetical protein AG1IA_08493 [Rhizoctonia solani AG-1 IA]|uniref:Uncharacterized protein n=1 Tax=Thanatephorus cucumeris (strain AG1-IA) TaxID=983506 RepID=L8WHQ5_THACA|nr:hypothetical protein AG1IA_08493 [Rhizoctonia solani AG-1 IA]